MGFWVQYHNLDRNDGYMPHGGQYGYEGELCVNTSVEGVAEAEGDTIFLIVGHQDRSNCLLWSRFVCKGIEPYNMDGYRWEVFGTGWTLVKRGSVRSLNTISGFADFRQSCNDFRRFQEISHLPFLETLLSLSEKYKPSGGAPEPPVKTPVEPLNPPSTTIGSSIDKATKTKNDPQPAAEPTDLPPEPSSNGGGFGNSEKNQLVEKAAIDAVQQVYEARGWVVESVEHKNCGYDLACLKEEAVEHVEVKGISGQEWRFIITAGEVRKAKEDSNFVLWVVTEALARPRLQRYSRDEFLGGFTLEVKDYWARLK